MKYFLLFIVCFAALYGYYVYTKTKDLLNPILTFSLPILLSVVVNLIFYDRGSYDISPRTYGVYLLGVAAFVCGCAVTIRPSSAKRVLQPVKLNYNSLVFNGYKLIAAIGTVFSIFYIFKGAASGVFGTNVIRNIRWYSLYVEQNSFIGKYSIVFIEIGFCIYAYKVCVLEHRDRKTKCWLLLFAIEYIVAIMTTMARTAILQFAVETAYFFMWGIQNKHRRRKRNSRFKIAILAAAALYAMQFLAIRTEKAFYLDDITGKTTNWLIPYLGKQFYIFDRFILPHAWVTRGINSFGFLGRVLQKLGILIPKYPIRIPGGQVASFITDPYTDFGAVGVIMVMLINGIVIGYIYRHAVKYSGWWLMFYSVCVYSCVISFYAFQFAMSSKLYFAVAALLLFVDGKLHLHVRDLSEWRKSQIKYLSYKSYQ